MGGCEWKLSRERRELRSTAGVNGKGGVGCGSAVTERCDGTERRESPERYPTVRETLRMSEVETRGTPVTHAFPCPSPPSRNRLKRGRCRTRRRRMTTTV